MSYRSEYINNNIGETKRMIAERQAANTNLSNQYVQDINAIVDKNVAYSVNKVQGEIDKLPMQYQSGFDANAVQQKINERQTAARMSDLGLTNSGLNRTQQTAINIQRSNADAALRQQMNATTASLKQQIADLYANAESQKAQTAAQAKYELLKTNQSVHDSMMDSLYANADSYANNRYKADMDAIEAANEAQQEANANMKYIDEDVQNEMRRLANAGDTEQFAAYTNYLIAQGYPRDEVLRWIDKLQTEEAAKETEENIISGLKGIASNLTNYNWGGK